MTRVVQMVVNLFRYGHPSYYDFFYQPGSIGSLQRYINEGWILKFIKDDPEIGKAVAVFEKSVEVDQ